MDRVARFAMSLPEPMIPLKGEVSNRSQFLMRMPIHRDALRQAQDERHYTEHLDRGERHYAELLDRGERHHAELFDQDERYCSGQVVRA
jgi:hypothetical protein